MTPAFPSSVRLAGPTLRVALPLLVASLCVAGCSRERLDNFGITYKIDIQQGVVVTQEMADQLKPGMTRDQVRFVLGTPILTDAFHADRWDYPFRFQPGRGPVELRHFTVFFDKDQLARFESDKLPTEEEFAASRNFATTRIAKAPPLQRPSGVPAPAANAPEGGATNTSVTPNVNIPIKRPQTAQPGAAGAPPQQMPPTNDSDAPR